MNSIIGLSEYDQSLSGILSITDGIATMENGVVTCKQLFVNGSNISLDGIQGPIGPIGPKETRETREIL